MRMADLHELTVARLARSIRDRSLSPVEVLEAYLKRIDRLEPSLNAWITMDREGALNKARLLEKKLAAGEGSGALCGVPIGVKDIFYTKGIATKAASPLYADFVPTYDATCIDKLKRHGAILLGKTVTTQFAQGDPTLARNPWNQGYNPGGSSTGSAVAVAARMCPVALGSQTGGSTLRPASYNGVKGFKPSYGRISKYGVFPCAWSSDTVGIFVHTVEDAAIMLQAMAGYDPKDPSSSQNPVHNYLKSLKTSRRSPYLGLVKPYFLEECDGETREHLANITDLLASGGAQIEEIELPSIFWEFPSIHRIIGHAEIAAVHEKNIKDSPDSYAPGIRAAIESGMLIPAVTYVQAQRLKSRFREELNETAKRFDALLTPSTPTPPQPDLSNTGDPKFQVPWTLAGLPAISLPSGVSAQGLPMGVQLISSRFSEGWLLAVAQWCEGKINFALKP